MTSQSIRPARQHGVGSLREPFDAAVRRHGETVLRVCRAVLGSDAEADDAWSETFLAALRAWPQLPDDTDVRAWLVTVAHRKAIDVIRRRGRQALPYADLPEPATHAGTDAADTRHDLTRAVAALPHKQRLCVSYHYLGDLPYEQVAALVGGTPAAARRAAADGIAALRRHASTLQEDR